MRGHDCDNCGEYIPKGKPYFVIPDSPVTCGGHVLADETVLCKKCFDRLTKGQKVEIVIERNVTLSQQEIDLASEILKNAREDTQAVYADEQKTLLDSLIGKLEDAGKET